jgi:hypothetical protein
MTPPPQACREETLEPFFPEFPGFDCSECILARTAGGGGTVILAENDSNDRKISL